MLGKICKHEIKATARYFLPLFLIALVLTPITRFTASIGEFPGLIKFIPFVVIFAYVASLLVVGAASVLLIIHRFYKSMVTEEGYLMHTLPVSTETHIFAKLIVAALWSIASALVIFISLFMMFYTPNRFSEFINNWNQGWIIATSYINGAQMTVLNIEIIVMIIIFILTTPLVFYASIAIGQIICKNKVLGSVIGFFIIQVISQILGTISIVPFGFIFDPIEYSNSITRQIQMMTHVFFPYLILISIITGVVLFLLTDFIFKKKLNLE